MTLEIPQRSGPSRGDRRKTMEVSGESVYAHRRDAEQRVPTDQTVDRVVLNEYVQLLCEANAQGRKAMRAMGFTSLK